MSSLITATIGPHGPHVLTTIIAVAGVFAISISKKLSFYHTLAFVFMAYYLHETIFHFIFIGARYFQGLSETVTSIFWSNLIGTDYAVSFAFIFLGLYIFRKRLHFSYPILLFIGVCSV
ncbi:MAG: hypothetical protein KGI38_12405 [Thaumarchaeota archaeon]|nr:hypothetical protein [Nitrososphaerota archaeon]